jgi:hypothetical protein
MKFEAGNANLKSIGDTIGPLVVSPEHTFDDSNGDKLSYAPARITPGGEITSKSNRTDFTGIRDGDCSVSGMRSKQPPGKDLLDMKTPKAMPAKTSYTTSVSMLGATKEIVVTAH